MMSVDHQLESDHDSQEHDAPGGRNQLLYRPWVVLALLFFVTLFIGLPLLWLSPRFSKLSKILVTIANLASSAFVLWAFYLLMAWCYDRISNALHGT